MPDCQLVMLTSDMLPESGKHKLLISWIAQFLKETTRGGGKSSIPVFLKLSLLLFVLNIFFLIFQKGQRKIGKRGGGRGRESIVLQVSH